MSAYARNRKLVERGHNNAATVDARNRKAEKYWDRWRNGVLLQQVQYEPGGRTYWEHVPTGRGLIHNGRKK